MGNSTTKLQDVIDYTSTIGDLSPMMKAGGFSNLMALTIANDVMTELLSERFNWKFNRMIVPPFQTNSFQQDYASINQKNIGWLEHAIAIDINNTALPKPIWWLKAVKDLERTSFQFGRPAKVCWQNNDQLVQGVWPGAGQAYVNPLGAVSAPSNPPTNILDANGNILVLTTYGVTGVAAPAAPAASASGVTVADGTCVWTVADPKAQGIRLSPMPPQTGITYQIYIVAQARPLKFATLAQLLDPIPDDYALHFRNGFIAYCHRHSTAPVVKARFKEAREEWLKSMAMAARQGDREDTDAGFIPDSGLMDSPSGAIPIGPAWPYGPF